MDVRRPAVAGCSTRPTPPPCAVPSIACSPARAGSRRAAGGSAQGAHRAARRLRLFGPGRRQRLRPARPGRARPSAASSCSARRTACRSAAWRCPAPTPSPRRSATSRIDAAGALPRASPPAAGRRQRRGARPEHSLEVQLPFLQTRARRLHAAARSPSAPPRADEVAEVLDLLWGGPETLIVVSSDLSHYHPYAAAQAHRPRHRRRDPRPGPAASTTSRPAARRRSTACCSPRAGAASRPSCSTCAIPATPPAIASGVVGYASFAFTEGRPMPATDLGAALLAIARAAIARALRPRRRRPPRRHATRWQRARRHLRHADAAAASCAAASARSRRTGRCARTSRDNALAAAFRDPRFAPLAATEFALTRVEVSLLSPPAPLPVGGEADLLRAAAPRRGRRRPRVRRGHRSDLPAAGLGTAARPARRSSQQLKRKAGLPPTSGHDDVRITRYTGGRSVSAKPEPRHAASAIAMSEPSPRPLVAPARRRPHPVRPLPARLPAARRPARRLLRAPARRRRDGAHHLRPLRPASASTRSRRSRSTTSTPASQRASPSAPPAATSPASSARTGTSRKSRDMDRLMDAGLARDDRPRRRRGAAAGASPSPTTTR